ncbi:unnamed protein product [Rotaria sp. Silwood1]|nr:unnamed protein product [Rotaria sp. Silwood1]
MGCQNGKVKPILSIVKSTVNSVLPATNDQLPVEIIYKILNELDIETIFVSLYHVCKRFDSILSTYDEYHFNSKTISLKNFDLICSRIRPEQVTELTLSDDVNSPGLVEKFLSRFTMNEFVRLRSLTLIQIDNEEFMNQILISIADHTSLVNFSSIKIINTDETYGDIFVELIMSVLAKPSLRKVYFELSYGRGTSNPLPWLEQCSFRHMIFKGNCSVSFVRNIFVYAPQLETFEANDFNFDEEIDLNSAPTNHEDDDNSVASEEFEIEADENPNHEEHPNHDENPNHDEHQIPRSEKFASLESTNYLISLTLEDCSMNMSKLEWMLQEMPTLKRFRLNTSSGYNDELILDGDRWTNLVSNMDKFEFVLSVYISDSSAWDTDECISTFRTSFWTEEKQCSKGDYHWNGMSHETKNAILPHFSRVTNLFLYGKWPKSKSFLSDIQAIIDLNTVEELTREEIVPTIDFIKFLDMMPNIKSIKTSTNLLDALNAAKFSHTKCLRSFIIDSNSYGDQKTVNIEPFCSMFPRIQHLIIPVDNIDSCQYVLDQLKADLLSVIFRITANDNVFEETDDESENEEENSTVDLFSEWIQELSKQYRCYKKQRHIHIWLQ